MTNPTNGLCPAIAVKLVPSFRATDEAGPHLLHDVLTTLFPRIRCQQ